MKKLLLIAFMGLLTMATFAKEKPVVVLIDGGATISTPGGEVVIVAKKYVETAFISYENIEIPSSITLMLDVEGRPPIKVTSPYNFRNVNVSLMPDVRVRPPIKLANMLMPTIDIDPPSGPPTNPPKKFVRALMPDTNSKPPKKLALMPSVVIRPPTKLV